MTHPFLVKDEWKVLWNDTKWKVVKRGKKIQQTSNGGHDRMVVGFTTTYAISADTKL